MSKFFGYVNELESHKNLGQYDLALEKYWVTQYGWIWLCATFFKGITINNCYKIVRYAVKRDQYDKLIVIRELLE